MMNINFGESLSGIILERNINSKDLAKQLGVSHESVNNWKSNRTGIELSQLIKLCKYFNCSLDYLVGITERDTKPSKYTLENFGIHVRKIMKSRNITTYKLQKETRYSGKYFNVWDRGSDPKLSTLLELANYFNCSLDELVGLE